MTDELMDIVRNIESTNPLQEDDAVLDIGSNDGALFKVYRKNWLLRVGFEPARSIV